MAKAFETKKKLGAKNFKTKAGKAKKSILSTSPDSHVIMFSPKSNLGIMKDTKSSAPKRPKVKPTYYKNEGKPFLPPKNKTKSTSKSKKSKSRKSKSTNTNVGYDLPQYLTGGQIIQGGDMLGKTGASLAGSMHSDPREQDITETFFSNMAFGVPGMVSGFFGAKKKAEQYREQAIAEERQKNFQLASNNFMNQMQQKPAALEKGGFIEYNGQTHKGPNGGIPVDPMGNPMGDPVALTESGEVAYFDKNNPQPYVFSNSLMVNDKESFADQAKDIKKKYKLRLGKDLNKLDPISNKGLEMEMGKLQAKQERLKAQEGSKNSKKLAQGGEIPGDKNMPQITKNDDDALRFVQYLLDHNKGTGNEMAGAVFNEYFDQELTPEKREFLKKSGSPLNRFTRWFMENGEYDYDYTQNYGTKSPLIKKLHTDSYRKLSGLDTGIRDYPGQGLPEMQNGGELNIPRPGDVFPQIENIPQIDLFNLIKKLDQAGINFRDIPNDNIEVDGTTGATKPITPVNQSLLPSNKLNQYPYTPTMDNSNSPFLDDYGIDPRQTTVGTTQSNPTQPNITGNRPVSNAPITSNINPNIPRPGLNKEFGINHPTLRNINFTPDELTADEEAQMFAAMGNPMSENPAGITSPIERGSGNSRYSEYDSFEAAKPFIAAQVGAGVLGNLAGALRKQPEYEPFNASLAVPETVSYAPERMSARKQASIARRNLARQARNSGLSRNAFISQVGSGSASINRNLGNISGRSYQNEINTNAQNRMRTNMFNAQAKNQAGSRNAYLKYMSDKNKYDTTGQYISGITQSVQGGLSDVQRTMGDRDYLNMLGGRTGYQPMIDENTGEVVLRPVKGFWNGRKYTD